MNQTLSLANTPEYDDPKGTSLHGPVTLVRKIENLEEKQIYTIIIDYSVYNRECEFTLKNTSCLPRLGVETGTSSCGTRKKKFAHDCAFHWLHRQGNNFLVNASSRVYRISGLRNRGYTYCTYNILS